MLQFGRARIERDRNSNGSQSATSSQACQENLNLIALTKPYASPGYVDGKGNLDNYLLRLKRHATIAGWQRDSSAVRLSTLLIDKALDVYFGLSSEDVYYCICRGMYGIMTSCGKFFYRGTILLSKDIDRGLGTLNQRDKNHLVS